MNIANTPLLSITCLSFNHVDFIRQCLEGLVMQKCDFEFEVLIHDDASTDGTADIIREYQIKYPNVIKPILQIENQWSKGMRGITLKYNISRAKGKYIAICEGDDYWTDPLKLQKQVDFLEVHDKYVMCFHNAEILYQNSGERKKFREKYDKEDYDGADILQSWLIPTASMVYRNVYDTLPDYMNGAPNGDMGLQLFLSQFGKFRVINEVMCVYRKHDGGVMKQFNNLQYYSAFIAQMQGMNNYFNNKFEDELNFKIFQAYNEIIARGLYENKTDLFKYCQRLFSFKYVTLKKNKEILKNTIKALVLNLIYGKGIEKCNYQK